MSESLTHSLGFERRMNRPELFVAKVKGWPWWPAKLADPSSQGLEEKKGAGKFVYFFGTRRCAWVKAEFCLPFYENIHMIAAKGKQDKLDLALAELETTLIDPVDTRKFRQAIHVEQGSYIIPEQETAAKATNGKGEESTAAGSKRKASASPVANGKDTSELPEAHSATGGGGGGGAGGGGKRESVQPAPAKMPKTEASSPAGAAAVGGGGGSDGGGAGGGKSGGGALALPPKVPSVQAVNNINSSGSAAAHTRADAAADVKVAATAAKIEDGRPLMLTEKVGWVGKPRPGDKKTFYDAFFKHGEVFRKGDCAYLKPPEEGVDPYVIRIESMWEEKSGEMQFKGLWFYRPHEVKKRPPGPVAEEELFLSDWADANPVESVMHKAKVLLLKAPPSEDQWGASAASRKIFSHVCCRSFFVRSGKYAPLTEKKIRATDGPEPGSSGAGSSEASAPKKETSKERVEEAAEGLSQLGGGGNRPEHWVPLHCRSDWEGVQYINRSNVLVRSEESLKPSAGTGRITCLNLSPNGELLASVSLAGCLCVWDVASQTLRHQFVDKARSSQPLLEYLSVALTHDGSRCVVGGCKRDRNKFVPETDPPEHVLLGGFLKVFDLHRTGQLQTIDVHTAPVTRMVTGWVGEGACFSQSGDEQIVKLVFDAGEDQFKLGGEVRCRGAGGMLLVYPRGVAGQTELSASALLVSADKGVRILDPASLADLGGSQELYQHRCTDTAFVPATASSLLKSATDAALFLTCGDDSKGGNAIVKLHQLRWQPGPDGKPAPALEELRRYEMLATVTPLSEHPACLVSNGRYAMRAVNTQLYVWNLDTQQLTAIVQHENGCAFTSMLLHPAQRLLFMGALTGQIECYRSGPAQH